MKQTSAVEWLVKIYLQTNKIDSFDIEQAKAMHKEELWQIFQAGQDSMEEGGKGFEQYYTNTYEK